MINTTSTLTPRQLDIKDREMLADELSSFLPKVVFGLVGVSYEGSGESSDSDKMTIHYQEGHTEEVNIACTSKVAILYSIINKIY